MATFASQLASLTHPRLRGLGLHFPGLEWGVEHLDIQSMWNACARGTWLWWVLEALDLVDVKLANEANSAVAVSVEYQMPDPGVMSFRSHGNACKCRQFPKKWTDYMCVPACLVGRQARRVLRDLRS